MYANANHLMQNPSRHVGSVLNHRTINRDRAFGHQCIYRDYFSDNPTYPDHIFRRRFRMRKSLFLRIQTAIESHDSYFVQKFNAVGVPGLSSLQKITAAMRIIAYGISADGVDDYIRIAKSTAIESVRKFVVAIVQIFGEQYLRSPNDVDIQRLMKVAEQRGFPGMLGSIDCMHWRWKNCPTAWHGVFSGRYHEPTIILEAIASHDLWIWHAYFGLPGSLNDINVLDRSNLFSEWAEGRAPKVKYTINGHTYDMGYYLADGIYPPYPTFVKTISAPQGNKRKHFAQMQESARKDVERAFGVLQARFAIVRGPARFWDIETLKYIMLACIVMHNMIIEDERDMQNIDYDYETYDETPSIQISRERTSTIEEFMQFHHRIRDKNAHIQLQNDLVEHLWQKFGG
nr:PREDICTED: putative nuclease HARBI1 [Daucus carota subsp. sativus]